ncbi:MAG: hypothetical protein F6K63_23895 [Moorea sp. SIO1G6]|uniref:hypothetical protein n=1 Tax=Moorena sp. SIO1G6 TaxID=2607840 RepID=UPI0013C21296|nr:hypothetical protein [Moorena sp. SIO1G6]NET67262.1 hypothetical protein [Moorena sp. SIO1G6]
MRRWLEYLLHFSDPRYPIRKIEDADRFVCNEENAIANQANTFRQQSLELERFIQQNQVAASTAQGSTRLLIQITDNSANLRVSFRFS